MLMYDPADANYRLLDESEYEDFCSVAGYIDYMEGDIFVETSMHERSFFAPMVLSANNDNDAVIITNSNRFFLRGQQTVGIF